MAVTSIDQALATLHSISNVIEKKNPFRRIANRIHAISAADPEMPPLTIGDRTASLPIVQGGMGVGISLSRLASAVAEAGGIGVIAAAGIGMVERDYYKDGRAANLRAFRREIRSARDRTDGLIGVNIMVALNDFHELLEVAIEERVDFVFMGAGLPIKGLPVDRMREAGVKAVPIVSSARATAMIFKMWQKIYDDVPDAVVVEGPLAGGHLGFSVEQVHDLDVDPEGDVALSTIVPEVVKELKRFEESEGRKIPVIAGGGVFDGADIYETLALGAAGVQMGTRFVATEECDADQRFKEAYVSATRDEIGLIQSPVGMPGRAIRNQFILDSEAGRRPAFRCAWQCLSSCKADKAKYCISIALNNARKGNLKQGFAFVGANGYRVTKITTVPALVNDLAATFREAVHDGIAGQLEPVVSRLRGLVAKYDELKDRIREVGETRRWSLLTRVRTAGDRKIAGVRRSYETLNLRLQRVQEQLAEGLAEGIRIIEGLHTDSGVVRH